MWVLRIQAPWVAESVVAGQFVNLKCASGPLLRRPFSVYDADPQQGWVDVVMEAVGGGTRMLIDPALSEVDLLGPLGRGYRIVAASTVALVSGGVGVAPMPLAARQAAKLGCKVSWIHGARSAAEVCAESWGDRIRIATDDGSQGFCGSVLELWGSLASADGGFDVTLACGPNPMLAALAVSCPRAQVLVETYMGCGTGVCLGCAVPLVSGGYDRACTEGPVYLADRVEWIRLPGALHYFGVDQR